MDKKLNILRAGDQNFWAYHWIAQEHSRYSEHTIIYAKHDEVNLNKIDVLYIHSPDITNYHAEALPILAKDRGIKVIGAYAGNPLYWSPSEKRTYSYADIIVAISPQTYSFGKFHYTNIPTIYMPECVDTNFFIPKKFNPDSFVVGWAGGQFKKIKRFHITKELNYPITLKDNWEKQRQSKDKNLTLAEMREFYHSIDVLIVTSESECQPRVVMEAMACGIPVIATNVGSMKMLLDDFSIVSNDEKKCIIQMNERLRILKKYPMFRQELGIQNRLYINRYFSWKSTKLLWDNLFTNVYNDNINQCIIDSEKFLKQFGDRFTSQLLKFESNKSGKIYSTEEIFKELISFFDELKIKYCLTKDTCKNMVLANKIIEGSVLQFGCNMTEQLKQKLLTSDYISIKDDFKKQNTIVKFEPLLNKTKLWEYNDKEINVPFPLVHYLVNVYGSSIEKELKKI